MAGRVKREWGIVGKKGKGETVGGKRVGNKETVAIYSVSNLVLGTTSEAFKTARVILLTINFEVPRF